MSGILTQVPLRDLRDHSRLFLDYVEGLRKGVPPFLAPVRGSDVVGDHLGPIETSISSEDPEMWKELASEVADLSERLGTDAEVVGKLRGEARPHFVVTGQQPGVLGGPLLAAYKVATAIALAAYLEKKMRHSVVPLYWCGSDDVDFPEIRSFNMLTSQLTLVTASIPQSAYKAGMPVGAIDTDAVRQMWTTVLPFSEQFSEHAFVGGVVGRALDRSGDHGELSAAVLASLFKGRVAVVDGRSGAVRRFAQPLLSRYVALETEIKSDVVKRGEELEKAGYHVQLATGADSGVFLVENGIRKSVTPERRDTLVRAVENDVERCSPGVIARNLVQDYAFKPLAVVLGPAEIAYRAQIGGVYDRLEVARPVDFPRLTATFVPGPLIGVFGNGAVDTLELLRDPSAAARSLYRGAVPRELSDAMEKMKREMTEAIDRFRSVVADRGSSKVQGRIQSRVKDLRKRIDSVMDATLDAGKAEAIARWRGLADIDKTIRPGHKPQERTLATLTPFLFGGEATSDVLLEAADRYLRDLLDGHPNHIVYSTE